jgi:hypothetical protein
MNLTPPVDPNAPPLDTVRMRRGTVILLGFAAFICLVSAFSFQSFGVMTLIFLAIPVLAIGYCLFFQAQAIEFFPTWIQINYLLRRRRLERGDIDFVSLEEYTSNTRGIRTTTKYVRLKLRNGRKIDLSGFQDDIGSVYQKLKACESTNEEFLKGR